MFSIFDNTYLQISYVNTLFKSFVFNFLNSTSTIYLELSLHTSSNPSISVSNLANELILSFPLASEGYTFGNKTITLQQYEPNNANAVYTLYNVRDVINNNNGIIVLPNLNGTYASQGPYAYFKIEFR